MEQIKTQRIELIEDIGNDEVKVTIIVNKKEMAEKFSPYYSIQDDLRKALLPILTEELLKNKDEIIQKVLTNVDWSEVVRSEVAQRVIMEIAKGKNLTGNY